MYFKQPPSLDHPYQQYAGNKLFPRLLTLKRFVDNETWNRFVQKLLSIFHKYPEAKPSFMGFPTNWKAILNSHYK